MLTVLLSITKILQRLWKILQERVFQGPSLLEALSKMNKPLSFQSSVYMLKPAMLFIDYFW